MKKFFLILLIIVIIVIGGGIAVLSLGKSVDIEWTEADYSNAIDKTEVKIDDIHTINLFAIARNEFQTKGINDITTTFTNAEMSALISKANETEGPISDFKVGFIGNDSGEISFKLTDAFADFLKSENFLASEKTPSIAYLQTLGIINSPATLNSKIVEYVTAFVADKPVYATGELSRTSTKSLTVRIDSLQVGLMPMNEEVISRVETGVEQFVNRFISSVDSFTIEELRVENGKLYFKGTLPAEITP
jgi:hypothetical protein